MPFIGSDPNAVAFESLGYLKCYSSPEAAVAARAAQMLAGGVKITAVGTAASNALAAGVTASVAARSLVSRPAGDSSRMNPSARVAAAFSSVGTATLSAILDGLDSEAMAALQTALVTRAT